MATQHKKRTKITKIILACMAAVVLLCMAVGIFYAVQGYQMYKQELEALPLQQMADDIRNSPGYVKLDEMPTIYLDAVIAAEDQRFYTHPGVDVLAIGRATWNNIKSMSFAEGGSTITQQLAKNQFFTQEKRMERKVAEAFMAFSLEKEFSKREILELYLNSIYFGEGHYGIGQGSRGYFNKEPMELSDGECVLLAGIPNAPSAYALNGDRLLARQRARQVLRKMENQGYLTSAQVQSISSSL